MQEKEIRELLEQVKTGERSVEDALKDLKDIPYHEMGFANVDHHRALRTGFPEAIFGQGKTAAQISAIMTELLRKGGTIMATRVDEEKAEAVRKELPEAVYYQDAKILAAGDGLPGMDDENAAKLRQQKTVAVVSAGTADIPIAEEAAVTAELLGNEVHRVYDVGVAGIHQRGIRCESGRHHDAALHAQQLCQRHRRSEHRQRLWSGLSGIGHQP